MLTGEFTNMKLAGVACALPQNKVDNTEFYDLFGKDAVDKVIQSTGISSRYICDEGQTLGDLGYAAAARLLQEKGVRPDEIGVLIFACPYPDYVLPGTSFVVQKRLGLSQDCIVYDFNLACSGFAYGLHTLCSLLQCSSAKKGLLVLGDTVSKVISPQDKSRLLFGDAGAAVLIEKTEESQPATKFALRSDGERFRSIIMPAGGFRLRKASRERTEWFDGNLRNQYELLMNGTDVFSFTMTDVPKLINEFMEENGYSEADFDSLLLHQANAFVMKHVAKRVKFPGEKIPICLHKYANTGGATIPLMICDKWAGQDEEQGREGKENPQSIHALAVSFGVGLSWGVAELNFSTDVAVPIFQTAEVFDGGIVDEKG